MTETFFHCSCYYTHNIYIKTYKKHFTYVNSDTFLKDYGEFLHNWGCSTADIESLIKEIILEIDRRKFLQGNASVRRKFIRNNYRPLCTSIYTLQEDFLDPHFIKLIEAAKDMNHQKVLHAVDKISIEKKIYGFQIFNLDFCSKFLKELQHFEESDIPKERPNTMNSYGVLIDDIGFQNAFSTTLRLQYLDPLVKILFPKWYGEGLDSHKIFTVSYKVGQDRDLGYHYDNSEVTLNVCLGKKFEGSELYLGDMNRTVLSESTCILVPHKVGYGILHRGQQYHGALPIISGERHNLIMWMRSSSIRNPLCPMCHLNPKLVPCTDYGDGFTNSQDKIPCNLL